MKLKYCFECEGSKDAGFMKLHHWIETDDGGCECKHCGLKAPKEDADEILGRRRK